MNVTDLTEKELSNMFDHTCLKPFAKEEDFKILCDEAKDNGFKMVAINSWPVAFCKQLLKGTQVHVGAAISFPLGQTTIDTKCFETMDAIAHGADEIDYVVNVAEVKNGNFGYIEDEMRRITEICRNSKVLVKVIFENCYLEKEEIKHLSEIAKIVEPDFIKTSTGFGAGGALAEDVRLMKETVGDRVKVKAAGGIRDWETCRAMIEAGAERIGTSSSFKILEGLKAERAQ